MTQRKAKSASKTKSRIRKRLTDRDKALRDERIVRGLAAGATNADIAAQEDLSPRRMRELTTDIFARRRIDPPDEFHQLQLARLNEAMLVSYAAMGGGNLKAVDRVIKLVGELDRFYGLAQPVLRQPPTPPRIARKAPPRALAPPAVETALAPPQIFDAATNGVPSD